MRYRPPRKLWAHQQEALSKMRGKTAFALFMGTRTGKTFTSITDWATNVCTGMVDDLLVIAPASYYESWEKAVAKDLSKDVSCYDMLVWSASRTKDQDIAEFMDGTDNKILVIDIEALATVKRAQELAVDFVKRRRCQVIVDECFVAGTKVDTPCGPRNIEDLVQGDLITSIHGPRSILRTFKRSTRSFVRVELSNDTCLFVTPSHPFFTEVGWVTARNLEGHYVYSNNEVRDLWKDFSKVSDEKILRNILLSEVEDAAARGTKTDLHIRKDRESPHHEDEERDTELLRVGWVEQREVVVIGSSSKTQSSPQVVGTHVQDTWREWPTSDETTDPTEGHHGPWMDLGICCRVGEEAAWLSHLLQGRPREPDEEAGNRVRRRQPQRPHRGRQEKRCEAERVRVVRVTLEERSDPVDVFDVEVEGCPFFFVGDDVGVLVHNSTTIKNPKKSAKQSNFVANEIGPHAQFRRILTGLPTPRSPLDIWQQFQFLDPSVLQVQNYNAFMCRYGVVKKTRFATGVRRQVVAYRNLDHLRSIIEPYTYTVELDVNREYERVPIELTSQQKRIYDDIKKYASSELGKDQRVTVDQVITMLLRLHQVVCGHVTDDDGNLIDLDETRTDAMLELTGSIDGKIVVWVAYSQDIAKVTAILEKAHGKGTVSQFWGGNRSVRLEEEQRFLQDAKRRFMVATPAAAKFGREWKISNVAIYHTNSDNLENRVQSEARTLAFDKDEMTTYFDIVARGTVEERIIENLVKKNLLATKIDGRKWKEWI